MDDLIRRNYEHFAAAPLLIDTAEVVRCSECKYADPYIDLDGCERIRCLASEDFYFHYVGIRSSWFCLSGERRNANG